MNHIKLKQLQMIKSDKVGNESLDICHIIKDIVDYLQPSLSPYESVIYWFMFRHSIVENGVKFTRASVTRLSKGIGSKFKNGDQLVRASDKAIGDNL